MNLRAGLVYRSLGFPPQFFTVLFAVPRVTGYLSHWRESLTDPDTKILRPQQDYRVSHQLKPGFCLQCAHAGSYLGKCMCMPGMSVASASRQCLHPHHSCFAHDRHRIRDSVPTLTRQIEDNGGQEVGTCRACGCGTMSQSTRGRMTRPLSKRLWEKSSHPMHTSAVWLALTGNEQSV